MIKCPFTALFAVSFLHISQAWSPCWRASLNKPCPLISSLINAESCHVDCLLVSGNGSPLRRQLCNSLSSNDKCTTHAWTTTGITTGLQQSAEGLRSFLLLIAVAYSSVRLSPELRKQMLELPVVFWQIKLLVRNERHSGLFIRGSYVCPSLLMSIMLLSRHAGASAACWSNRRHFPI